MRIALTTAGIAALQSSSQPVVLTSYKLGSGSGYIPSINDTDIHGTSVFTGVPQSPIIVNANVVKYGVFMSNSVGPFNFGEIGFYMSNGDLFALACDDITYNKQSVASNGRGNSISIEAYLTQTNGSYDIWIDLGTNNELKLPIVPSVDQLPQSQTTAMNIYAVNPATSSQSTFLAYTDRNGLWMFDAYKFSSTIGTPIPIISANSNSITIDGAYYTNDWITNYLGNLIIEFASGSCYSICRNVQSVIDNGANFTVTFATPLFVQPKPGDLIVRFNREGLSTSSLNLPVATQSALGGVIIGAGITVDISGRISVDASSIPGGLVTSVNGITGDVNLTAAQVPGTVRSVNGNSPDGNGNVVVTTNYNLPTATATTKGGVIVPGPDIVINTSTAALTLGFTPVKTVNGDNGDVTITGLITPTALVSGNDLNNVTNVGLYYAATSGIANGLVNAPNVPTGLDVGQLEVLSVGSSNRLQRWSQADGYMFERLISGGIAQSWNQIGGITGIPVASTSTLGVVRIGNGLAVDSNGVVTSNLTTVNSTSPDSGGNVNITLDSLGGIPSSQRDVQGGIATLSSDPDTPITDQVLSDYLYKKVSPDNLPLGVMQYVGNWNATTNSGTYEFEGIAHTVTLLDDGQMTDEWTIGSDTFSYTVDANGKWFRVSTAGTTSVDGIATWAVGDLILAVGSRWVKISQSFAASPTSGTFSLAANASQSITIPPGFASMTASLQLKVEDPDSAGTWYDAIGVATIAYTSSAITVTNDQEDSLNFSYYLRP